MSSKTGDCPYHKVAIFSLAASAASYGLVAYYFRRCSTRAMESGHSQCLGDDAHYLLVNLLATDVEFVCSRALDLVVVSKIPGVSPYIIQVLDFPRRRHTNRYIGSEYLILEWVVSFVLLRCPDLSINRTVIRPIGSIIDRKIFFYLKVVILRRLLNLYEYISLRELATMSIRIPSRFSQSGFGSRWLSVKEQHLALDVLLWAMLATNVTPDFRPLKASSAIADIILSKFAVVLSISLGCDRLKPLVQDSVFRCTCWR